MQLKMLIEKTKLFILDILFPIECLGCGKEDIWLCDECLSTIPIREVDSCVVCKRLSPNGVTHPECQKETALDGVIISCPWESKLLQKAIHVYKYNFVKNLSYPLSQLIVKKLTTSCHPRAGGNPGTSAWVENTILDNFSSLVCEDNIQEHTNQTWIPACMGMVQEKSCLIPIPLHPRRLRWRGFNQAELLAEKLADYLYIPLAKDILIRKRYTQPQMSLKRKKRLENLSEAFTVTEHLDHKNIILIDDVLTTGSTMNECAKVLKASGAQTVWGLCLARG